MSQISFSDAEYAGKRKKTRREVFLEEMEAGGAVEGAARPDRAALPGSWPRPQAVPAGVDAAGAPDAELVCAERPGDGRGVVRDRLAARVRAAEPGRADSGRDDDPELPSPARSQRPGRGHPQGGQRGPGKARVCCSSAAASSTPPSSPRRVRPRTPRANAIRRCIRRRRATSGTSA